MSDYQPPKEPTVANLVEALLKLPPDAIVEVSKAVDVMGGYATIIEHHPIDIEDTILHDFTVPPYNDPIRYPRMAGKKIVCLHAQ